MRADQWCGPCTRSRLLVMLLVLLALQQMEAAAATCPLHQAIPGSPSQRPHSRGLGAVASSSKGDEEGGWEAKEHQGTDHHSRSTHAQTLQMPAASSLNGDAPVEGLS